MTYATTTDKITYVTTSLGDPGTPSRRYATTTPAPTTSLGDPGTPARRYATGRAASASLGDPGTPGRRYA